MGNFAVALIVVSSAGWVTFAAGFVWNAITTPKRRMAKNEAIEFTGHRALPATTPDALARRSLSGTWFRGTAWGLSWSDEMSLPELKAALRRSPSQASARYQQFALAVGGFVVGLSGLVLLLGWEVGIIGFLVAMAIVLYVSIQLTRALVRA